jgi:hypothetical protein
MKQVILFFALAGSAFGQYTIGMSTATNALGLQAATPTFSPAAGTYSSTQTVTISTATPLAVLCYTTDGSTPTESANLCSGGTTTTYSTPITVSTTQTVKAIATLAGYTDSSPGTALYTISAGSTIAFVGTPVCGNSSSSSTPISLSYSPTAGNALAIVTGASGAAYNIASVGDNQSETYVKGASENGASYSASEWTFLSVTSGVTTVTVHLTSSVTTTACVLEYRGVVNVGTVPIVNTWSTSVTSESCTLASTTGTRNWIVVAASTFNSITPTATAGTVRKTSLSLWGMDNTTVASGASLSATANLSGTGYSGACAGIELKSQ